VERKKGKKGKKEKKKAAESSEEDNESSEEEAKPLKKVETKGSSSSKGPKEKQEVKKSGINATKKNSNSDSDEEGKESGSKSKEESSEDEGENSQVKDNSSEVQVVEPPVTQKSKDSAVIATSVCVVDRDSELKEKDIKGREIGKETKKEESSDYQPIGSIYNPGSFCISKVISTYMPPSPDSNDKIEVWKDYVRKLKDFRDTLKRKNERIEENIEKIREKSDILEKELKKVDNNDALLNKIASLLTEKRNEMRQSFTCV